MPQHQYIDRQTGRVRTEKLFADPLVRFLYAPIRENAPRLFRLMTGRYSSSALSLLNYDWTLASILVGHKDFLANCGVDLDECVDAPESLNTPRKVFERKIRYWDCRPMDADERTIVSPADARILLGSFRRDSAVFIKDKFFSFEELLGRDSGLWLKIFSGGDFAVLRLTPDKYHYNHTPVAGEVIDCYAIDGTYHACNPDAVVSVVTPYSKNKRFITIINTDVPGGSQVGRVAMVEVVALMIGDIVQCYSEKRYDAPVDVRPGLFVEKGCPKSLYRPGSSTDLLIFEPGRITFAPDLLTNQQRLDAQSRFSRGFQQPLVETEIRVREEIGYAQSSGTSTTEFEL